MILPQDPQKTTLTANIYDIVIIDEQSLVDYASRQKHLQMNTETSIPFIILSTTDKLLKNTIILQEILHDFAEISKITTDYSLDDDDEALDNSYKQISNYVVASSYDIYNGSKEEIFKNE